MRRGIAFSNISNLHLSHLEIINCGREIPSGLPGHINDTFAYLGPLQKAVLVITHSTNATVESVSINRCFGFGMLFVNLLGQTVTKEVSVSETKNHVLSECTQLLERRDMLCSGSGVVFIFNDTDATDKLVKDNGRYTASLYLIDCYFSNNTNLIPTNFLLPVLNTFGVAFTTKRFLLTGGFSIGFYMGQRGYFVDVKITNTTVLSNKGNLANFFVLHYNTLGMTTTQLDRVVVSDNELLGVWGRGAGLLVFGALFLDTLGTFMQPQEDILDLVEISNSKISNNSAGYGGGIMFYVTPQNISDIRLVIRDTILTGNIAAVGPALYVFQLQSLIGNKEVHVYLENVVASRNTFPGAVISENSPKNAGVFFVGHISNITLVGTQGKGCLFQNNRVSVVMAVSTNVVLRGRMKFENNSGFRGGALSLIDSSTLFIHNSSVIDFTNNTAFQEGGAIYVNTLGSLLPLVLVPYNSSLRKGSIFHAKFYYLLIFPLSFLTTVLELQATPSLEIHFIFVN